MNPRGNIRAEEATAMITMDAGRRSARQEELLEELGRRASAEDRDLLLSFARVVLGELPDPIALGLSTQALADRMQEYFHFFVREFPKPTQLYRGLPGIHVSVRNPAEADEQRIVHGK